mmetsp:Transcript_5850/g.23958  ORF Transcript_5850/g.23958 Transcript_5850/m.23958 type:complete len:286 (+) Transcript_5850:232-1089(+)
MRAYSSHKKAKGSSWSSSSAVYAGAVSGVDLGTRFTSRATSSPAVPSVSDDKPFWLASTPAKPRRRFRICAGMPSTRSGCVCTISRAHRASAGSRIATARIASIPAVPPSAAVPPWAATFPGAATPSSVGGSLSSPSSRVGAAPPIAATISSARALLFASSFSSATICRAISARTRASASRPACSAAAISAVSRLFVGPVIGVRPLLFAAGAVTAADRLPARVGSRSSVLFASRQYLARDAADANIARDKMATSSSPFAAASNGFTREETRSMSTHASSSSCNSW